MIESLRGACERLGTAPTFADDPAHALALLSEGAHSPHRLDPVAILVDEARTLDALKAQMSPDVLSNGNGGAHSANGNSAGEAPSLPETPVLMLAHSRAEGLDMLQRGATDFVVIGTGDDHTSGDESWLAILNARMSAALHIHHLKTRLEAGERRFRMLIQRNADAILVIDTDGIVRFANPAVEALFDQPARQLLGTYFGFPLLVGETTELDIVNPRTGRRLIAEMRVVEVEWERARAHLASLRDITERKLLEAERTEREKLAFALDKEREMRGLKERFLTMMSHELRTPLALIRLSYDMLRHYGARASEEEREQYLDNIHVQVNHLTEMIQDVMAVSRSENPDHEFDPEVTDLVAYCGAIVKEFQQNYRKTHTILFETAHRLMRASVDRRLLRQALINLISNAIKYSPDGTDITVRLAVRGREALLTVVDHGIGVPPDDVPRLFEPFHRGSNVDTIPGTGLGLTIVAGVVKAHKGRVEIDSQVGAGTTFTLVLPVVVATA
ncbi:MAG: ATP-binding protein [bacterium]|nr:ATP-binding protein [bacterium]